MKNYLQKLISIPTENGPQREDSCSAEGKGKSHGIHLTSAPILPLVASGSYLEKGGLFLGISAALLVILIIFRLKFRKE